MKRTSTNKIERDVETNDQPNSSIGEKWLIWCKYLISGGKNKQAPIEQAMPEQGILDDLFYSLFYIFNILIIIFYSL